MKHLLFVFLLLLGASLTFAQSNYATPYTFSTLAGSPPLYGPSGVATDVNGNVYVADTGHGIILKITPAGETTTLAGLSGSFGSSDGMGSEARFYRPFRLAVDAGGNVYVGDYGYHTIRKISPTGMVTTLAGMAGRSGSNDATGSNARFDQPQGVAVDTSGNVYVADTSNNTIRKITPTGVVTTLAGMAGNTGSSNGKGSAAGFNNPTGVAVDGSGCVYVADSGNHTIRKITPVGIVTTLAGLAGSMGSRDGTGNVARFNFPTSVAADVSGNVYVSDDSNHTIRLITPAGVVTTLAGLAGSSGSIDGTGSMARFYHPTSVALDARSNIYVADSYNNLIRKISPVGLVTTFPKFGQDGMGSAGRFSFPTGVAVDTSGNIYVGDSDNQTIRKITQTGVVTTLAGLAGAPGSGDGIGGAARFDWPQGVAVDLGGNVYVADYYNATIRKITPVGVVTTLAGLARGYGSNDGPGSAARFESPTGMAVDPRGNVYVADQYSHTIRKITPAGMVATLAGLAGTSGSDDGMGSAARFNNPKGVAVDSSGYVYVADTYNHTIRKITPAGMVTTLAGLAGAQGISDGTGNAARFTVPYNLAVDVSGNIYVTDNLNGLIRKISPAGVVITVAGLPGNMSGSDGIGNAARFNDPRGVAVDARGKVYLADSGNCTIRVGTPPGIPLITSSPTLAEVIDVPLSYQIMASNFPSSYSFTGSLPHGLAFNPSTGLLSGTPTQMGTFKLTLKATNAEGTGTALLSLIITKTPQTITFPTAGNLSIGTPYTLAATASSGLPVTYPSIHGPATLSGNRLIFTGVGTVAVKCRQSGDATYAPAPDLTITLTIAKATQTITFPTPGNLPFGTPYTLAATASSGLPVTYPAIHGPATLSGNQLTFTGVGLVTVKCRQPGNANYNPAPDLTLSLTVVKALQTIAFPHIGAVRVGQAVTLAATSSSGLPITYAITTGSGVVSGNTVTFSVAGLATVRASQAGNATIAAATTVSQNVSVR